MQLFLNAQQLGRLFLLDRSNRHTGPAAHHVLNVLARHNPGARVIQVILVAECAQVFALLPLFVRVEPRLLELVIRDGVLHPVDDEFDPLLHVGDIRR